MNWQNPYYSNFFPQNNPSPMPLQNPTFTTTLVSDITEATATKPDITGKPLFFYNKANEEIYLKQYDNTGAAPIKVYKLLIEPTENKPNPFEEGFKSIDNKLNEIKKLLTSESNNERERNKRQ